MKYAVVKPVEICGKRRVIGEILNDGELTQRSIGILMRSGYLTKLESGIFGAMEKMQNQSNAKIEVPILKKDGEFSLSIGQKEIARTIRMMQMNVDEIHPLLAEEQNDDVLILLNACDTRKAVKEAAKKRAEELKRQEEPAEIEGKGEA